MYGVANDRWKELEDYVMAQRERRAAKDSPEYRASIREDREANAEADQNGSLGALLAQSAAQFGTIGGKTADASPVQRYADASSASRRADAASAANAEAEREKRYGVDAEVYKYMADKEQRQEDTGRQFQQHTDDQTAAAQRHKEDLAMRQKQLDEASKTRREDSQRRKTEHNEKMDLDRDKLQFDRDKENAPGKAAKRSFDALSEDKKQQIDVLSKKVGDRTSIANMLESEMKVFQTAESDEQRLKSGQMMLKTLNAALGADAIGAEEAKRMGSFLEYKIMNIRGAGSMFGRDFDLFEQQVNDKLKGLRSGIAMDKQEIDRDFGRPVGEYPVVTPPLTLQNGGSGTAQAAPAAPPPPKPGAVIDGYIFKGGDPANPASWEQQ